MTSTILVDSGKWESKRLSAALLAFALVFGLRPLRFVLAAPVKSSTPRRLRSTVKSAAEEQIVYIPGGKFIEGMQREQIADLGREFKIDPDELGNQSYRQVNLPGFFIDKYEVTNRAYQRFLEATGHRLPLAWLDQGYPTGQDDSPVVGVDFHDAEAYCRWAGKRLPTEEEWEKAARGPDGRLWPWGNEWQSAACKMDDGDGGPLNPFPAPAGSFPHDSSVYGVMDMAGNVSEWVEGKAESPLSFAIVKGGSFAQSEPYSFLSSGRFALVKRDRLDYLGFRCACAESTGTVFPTPSRVASPGQQSPVGVTERRTQAGVPTPRLRPDGSLYRSRPIQLLPVKDVDRTGLYPLNDIDRTGMYQSQAVGYLPDRTTELQNTEKMQPWRLEVEVPYLPSDRFALWFELYWELDTQVLWFRFSPDNTKFELSAVKPGQFTLDLTVHGGLDYVDLAFDVKNIGQAAIPRATETCFQTQGAPNFRDNEGARTMVMTGEGFKPMTQLRDHVTDRRLMAEFSLDSSVVPLNTIQVSGPLIAIVSRDHRWLVSTTSMSGRPVRLVNNCEWSCIHANPRSRVEPGKEMKVKERIYFLQGSLEKLVARWREDVAGESAKAGGGVQGSGIKPQ